MTVFEAYLVAAAMTVPGVVSASCTITAFAKRTVTGQITFLDDTGGQGLVSL